MSDDLTYNQAAYVGENLQDFLTMLFNIVVRENLIVDVLLRHLYLKYF